MSDRGQRQKTKFIRSSTPIQIFSQKSLRRRSKTSLPTFSLTSFFKLLGRPLFLLLIFLASLPLYLIKLIPRHKKNQPKQKSKPIKLPSFPTIKISLPKFALPSLPKLPKLPSFTLPSISFPTFPKTSLISKIFVFSTLGLFSLTFLLTIFYFLIIKDLPSPSTLSTQTPKLTTQIFDRHGTLLYQIYTDENRQLIHLSDLPPYAIQAVISIEDKHFYEHQGVSLEGILRAFNRNLNSSSLQGGSTITQQLIKNTLLTRERTLQRKIKELILAVHTELLYTKDQILEMYLNQVSFGGTAYGIQSAAKVYFNKDAHNLTLPEAALLAGLPQSPTRYSPFGLNPKLALARQREVLHRMQEDGHITKQQEQEAAATPITFSPPQTSILAPHFVMYVKDLLVKSYGEQLVHQGGLKVYTTLDLSLQQQAQNAVVNEVKKLKNLNVNNAAALITNPSTGEVLSMVGSINYFDTSSDGQVNLTTSLRQPGSSVKPINYALAFENGFTPSQTIEDSPITFSTPGSPPWTPKNYDNRFHGQVSLRTALASSYNIPAIKLLARNGVPQMALLAKNLGITTWDDQSRLGLSLTLGGVEVKMTDMATAYSAFANYGTPISLNPILKVTDQNDQQIPFTPCLPQSEDSTISVHAQTTCLPQNPISTKTAYYINDVLSDPLARAPAFGLRSILNIPGNQVAVKTGTSNDLRDNWTIGYTPQYLVATWVGNNDNSPMSGVASGITGASPIWATLMTSLLKDQPAASFSLPSDLVKVPICPLTHTLTCQACSSLTRQEVFVKGTEPKINCSNESVTKLIEEKQKQQALTASNPQILDGASTSR